jgi:dolichol-phosphate mannosyltransferase
MQSTARPDVEGATGKLSLILPLPDGTVLDRQALADYRHLLENQQGFRSVEVLLTGAGAVPIPGDRVDGADRCVVRRVRTDAAEWNELARAGLDAATGDHLLVLDVGRHYRPESLVRVLEPVLAGNAELAVAVEPKGRLERLGPAVFLRPLGVASRFVLGSADVFSGLFALRRSLWERGGRALAGSGSSLVLELLLRRPSRCVDVPVAVGPEFRRQRFQPQDLRPLKHVLDGRYGSFSRLIQFCFVGASGMVVDLSLYALFQLILSFTPLATASSPRFGFSWNLAIAGALSISIALLWNFTLNRRLTFNDARGGSWGRQFVTYALSNALAIALSFTLRLYLPTRIGFFARHRLAAAVVGIVGATGLSFSMSRWIVFARRPELARAAHQAQVAADSAMA